MKALIAKTELLRVLRANRRKHRDVFEKALDGWAAETQKLLRAEVRRIGNGSRRSVSVSLPVPQDHTRDYTNLINAVELDVRDSIELDDREIARYLNDDWEWKREFAAFSTRYAAESYAAAYADEPYDATYNA